MLEYTVKLANEEIFPTDSEARMHRPSHADHCVSLFPVGIHAGTTSTAVGLQIICYNAE